MTATPVFARDPPWRTGCRWSQNRIAASMGQTRSDLWLLSDYEFAGKLGITSQPEQRGSAVSKVSKDAAGTTYEAEGFSGRYSELDQYTVGFETYTAEQDLAPLFAGLPDDRCQCPHWGVVVNGKVSYHYVDGDDVIGAGEAYFARPGHTPEIFAGTELVEFSPTAELARTLEVVAKNMGQSSG